MRWAHIFELLLVVLGSYVVAIVARSLFDEYQERHADHVHRYQQRLYLGQFEPYPVNCWADSHPDVLWPARKDGNCFLEDAPWLRSYLR